MRNDAGEGQRNRPQNQARGLRRGGIVGALMALGMAGPAAAKIEFLPDSIQWICRLANGQMACWDAGHAGDARLVDQCGDARAIDAEGDAAGVLVLRDPAYEDTHVVLPYTGRAIVGGAGPDGRPALVLWADPDRALLSDGFEACRQWIR